LEPDGIDDPEAKAIRRVHAQAESYIKAAAFISSIFSVWPILTFLGFGAWFMLAATGKIDAPWLMKPFYIGMLASSPVLAVLGLFAGYGLRRFRPWALIMEAVFSPLAMIYFGTLVIRDISWG
jgi:hypothetical protein